MAYHQTVGSGTQPATPWLGSVVTAKPNISVPILQQILNEIRRALAHDPDAAQAEIIRLSAILDGSEVPLTTPVIARGGFAPWQKRRVEAYLAGNLQRSIPLKTLAQMVSLSASHFCRAFKQSFGKTPHAYLMGLRIECAQEMMLSTGAPLSQIALACGMADQAHLTKVFHRFVGQTPSVWRRLHDNRN